MEDEYGSRPEPPPPRYSMLNGVDPPAPPPRRPQRRDSRRHSGCVCGFFFCFLFILPLFIVGAVIFILAHYKPEVPSFSVDGISVRALELNASDHMLHAKMVASLRTMSANGRFGFSYRSGSRVSFVYRKTTLCQGRLPSFYQALGNSTAIDVVMEGHRRFDERLQVALRDDEDAGRVPVKFYVRAPITLRLGGVDVTEVVVNVAVTAVVSSLSPNSTLDVNNADTTYDINVEF